MIGMSARIQIELYGVPRLRAGVGRVSVEASTVCDALDALARACPALAGTVLETREGLRVVHPAYRMSVNAERFVTDPRTALADGDTLLLFAADVGG
jgi:molybdopterin converting factor small subunit